MLKVMFLNRRNLRFTIFLCVSDKSGVEADYSSGSCMKAKTTSDADSGGVSNMEESDGNVSDSVKLQVITVLV